MAILGGGPISSVPISGLEGAAAAPEDFILGIEDGSNGAALDALFDHGNQNIYEGSISSVVVADVVAIVEPLYSPNIEFHDDSFTDWSDWSWAQAPPIDDNNPEVAPQALDDQDFTDTADYGSQTAVAIDDNDQGFQQSSVTPDEADTTDFADYGAQSDPLSDNAAAAPQDFLLGISEPEQDFTDFADYGTSVAPLADDAGCQYPVVLSITKTINNTSALTHDVTLPSFNAGDRLVLLWGDNFNNSRSVTTGGWTEVLDVTTSSIFVAYRDMVGGEAATITVTNTPDTTEVVHYVLRLQAGTFDGGYAPQATHTLNGADPANPPSLSPSWGTEKAMWIAFCATDSTVSPITMTSAPLGYRDYSDFGETGGTAAPDCMAGYGIGFYNSGTQNPGAFAFSAAETSWDSATIAIKGLCDPVVGIDGSSLDYQDFTDFADYGFNVDPLSGDRPEDAPLGDGQGLDNQDFTDTADYGSQTNQPIDDNNPEVGPQALDDQDFTDLAGYGTQTDQAIGDNNPDLAPSALDDQDFTDLSDYGTKTDPLSDNISVEDFLLGVGTGQDDQDFTDFTDYGSQTNPYPSDNNPGLAPSALDDQDFTDFTDYGSQTNPYPDDNNPEVAVAAIALDSQDFTDTADYGSQTDQAIDSLNFDLAPSALDDQDFTDFTDYGYSVDPLSDDLREDILLGDGQGLDDQDFTDLADYGSQSDPLSDDFVITIEDFILGYGSGLDEQDWTDHTDYSYVLEPNSNYADVSVLVTGGNIVVGIGCFEVISWIDIPDVSSIWTGVPEPTMTWNPIAEASNSWSDVTEPANPWVDISDPANTWTEEC